MRHYFIETLSFYQQFVWRQTSLHLVYLNHFSPSNTNVLNSELNFLPMSQLCQKKERNGRSFKGDDFVCPDVLA